MGITEELRTACGCADDMVSFAAIESHDFDRICDRIDYEHERLERENGRLRRGVADLKELLDATRETDAWRLGYDEGFASADDALSVLEGNGVLEEHGWVRLPRDADDEHIHIGDKVYRVNGGLVYSVESITLYSGNASVFLTSEHAFGSEDPCKIHHYHATTVEDMLQELTFYWDCAPDGEGKTAVLREYAAKLRLAGEEGDGAHHD